MDESTTESEAHDSATQDADEPLAFQSGTEPRLRDIKSRAQYLRRGTRVGNTAEFFGSSAIHGDLVSGDKIVLTDAATPRLLLSSPPPLPKPPFLVTPYFEEIQACLKRNSFAVLVARPAVGARVSAIRALADAGPNVAEVDPRQDLSSLADADIPKNTGLLLDRRASDTPISRHELGLIEAVLSRADSRLVILISQVTNELSGSIDNAVKAENGPTAEDVVWSWFKHQASSSDEQLDVLEITGRLKGTSVRLTLEEAAIFGTLLAESTADDRIGEALERVLDGRDERVSHWLTETLGGSVADDAALLIATLVLSGCDESVIFSASRTLTDMLVGLFPEAKATKEPFARPLSARISALNIERVDGSASTSGFAREKTLAIPDPSLSEVLLQHVWFEYGLQEQLYKWLRTLPNGSSDVVSAAATAAGQLMSKHALQTVESLVIPWSKDEAVERRYAAALTLGLSAWVFDAETQVVVAAVQQLAASRDGRQQWTAALSIGLGIGYRFPRLALSLLDNLMRSSERRVTFQAVAGLSRILEFAIGSDEDWTPLADLLLWWIGHKSRGQVRSEAAITALGRIFPARGRSSVVANRASLAALARLVGALLALKVTRERSYVLLRHMIVSYDTESIRSIIPILAPTERDMGRLEFIVRRFSRSSNTEVAEAAAKLLVEMGELVQ